MTAQTVTAQTVTVTLVVPHTVLLRTLLRTEGMLLKFLTLIRCPQAWCSTNVDWGVRCVDRAPAGLR